MERGPVRNQGGCWECKKRRVRCTGEQPSCRSCTKRNQHCQYGLELKWEQDAMLKGIAHGRQGIWFKTKPNDSRHTIHRQRTRETALPLASLKTWQGKIHFINTGYVTFQGKSRCEMRFEDDYDQEEVYVIPNPPLRASLSYGAFEPDEKLLWSYFIQEICPSCTLSFKYNPYLEYVVPLAFYGESIRHALIGIAAAELEWRTGDSRYKTVSVLHKTKALRALHQDLAATSTASNLLSLIPHIAASSLMLCFFEIADNCSTSWTTHMKGARDICNRLLINAPGLCIGFRRFYLMYFVAHEVMGHTAWHSDVLFDTSTWFAEDDEEEIDPLMGCSRGLMHAISSVSGLATAISQDTEHQSSGSFLKRRHEIEQRLHSLHQISRLSDEAAELESIAETKRLCAIIYLHARLDKLNPGEGPIPRFTARVLDLLHQLPMKGTLLWPIFVIGTMGVQNEEERRQVLDMLQKLLDSRPLSSIRKARAVIIDIWIARDLGKCDCLEGLIRERRGQLSLA